MCTKGQHSGVSRVSAPDIHVVIYSTYLPRHMLSSARDYARKCTYVAGTNIKNKLLLPSVVTKRHQLAENHRRDTHMQLLSSR